jgi:hypothetical protein
LGAQLAPPAFSYCSKLLLLLLLGPARPAPTPPPSSPHTSRLTLPQCAPCAIAMPVSARPPCAAHSASAARPCELHPREAPHPHSGGRPAAQTGTHTPPLTPHHMAPLGYSCVPTLLSISASAPRARHTWKDDNPAMLTRHAPTPSKTSSTCVSAFSCLRHQLLCSSTASLALLVHLPGGQIAACAAAAGRCAASAVNAACYTPRSTRWALHTMCVCARTCASV